MNRYAHGSFSDDIRYELGNKISLIGIYGSDMIVPQHSTIQKLACTAYCATPQDHPFKTIKLQILLNDAVLTEITFPERDIERSNAESAQRALQNPDTTMCSVMLQTFILNLSVETDSILRALVIADDVPYKAARLRIIPSAASQ